MAALSVVVALKWSVLVDEASVPGDAVASLNPNRFGLSLADRAALELGLRLSQRWGCPLTAVTVGPVSADGALRVADGVGVGDLRRIDRPADRSSSAVAADIAAVCSPGSLLIGGDASADRGSGTVGAFAAAVRGTPMALGLVNVEPAPTPGVLTVERRLDRGGRERLEVRAPAVISVEGTVATLRRATLSGALAATQLAVAPQPGALGSTMAELAASPPRQHRVRTRTVVAPSADLSPQARVLQLVGATRDRRGPRLEYLDAAAAAEAILRQLQEWGYLP